MQKPVKIIALFGKSGSGKDTVQNLLVETYPDIFRRIVSCTTRPKRSNEVEGFDYHFLTEEEFAALAYDGKFIEALEFNGWFYGALADDLDPEKINIGIFTPEGIETLLETAAEYELKIFPIYIRCADVTRIFRALQREICPDLKEMRRRLRADEEDFDLGSWDYSYCTLYNEAEPMDKEEILLNVSAYCLDFFE